MMISLRAGSKVYINGAVLKVDRKVNIELLNDVTFLLDAHVLQAHEANTPLRQLYFVVQTILMDPAGARQARDMLAGMIDRLRATFDHDGVRSGLRSVCEQVGRDRAYEALRTIRGLYPIEAAIMAGPALAPVQAA